MICRIIKTKAAFKKQYNGRKYNWIQLAGHAGRFKPGNRDGFILKHMDAIERRCFEKLQLDLLKHFVPKIDRLLFDIEECKRKSNSPRLKDYLYITIKR